MLNYFQQAITKPFELTKSRKMTGGQFFRYILLLTLILSLGFFGLFASQLWTVSQDVNELNEILPSFKVENSQLQPENPEMNSFVYQSDNFLFFFDPQNEMTEDFVDQNLSRLQVPIGIALFKDRLYTSTVFDDYNFPYSGLPSLEYQQGSLESLVSWQNILFTCLTALGLYYGLAFINVMITSLLSSIFAFLIAKIMQLDFSFVDSWKIIVSSMTLPVIVFSILNIFNLVIPFQANITGFVTMILFFISAINYRKKHS